MTKQTKQVVKETGVPSWALQPWREFVQQSHRLAGLLRLSTTGISIIQTMPKMVEALAQAEQDTSEEAQQTLGRAEELAELAVREVDEGFPLLYAQYTIAMWAALEATVRLFTVRWLQNHEPAMDIEAIKTLRVRLGEYERLGEEERCFYIIEQLEQDVSASLKKGVGRFESLLKLFGLSGPVDDDIRRGVFELSEVRNALIHRSGIADRRLVENCPWLVLSVGEPVKTDQGSTTRYLGAIMDYSAVLVHRIGDYFRADMSKEHDDTSAPGSERAVGSAAP